METLPEVDPNKIPKSQEVVGKPKRPEGRLVADGFVFLENHEKNKRDFFLVAIFKAMFYTDDRSHFSRKALMNVFAFTFAFITGAIMTAILVLDFLYNKKVSATFAGVVSAYWSVNVLGMAFQYTYGKKIDNSTEVDNGNGNEKLP